MTDTTVPQTGPELPQLLCGYENTARENLQVGQKLQIPQGRVGIVVDVRGQITDVLPCGLYQVTPTELPGLARAVGMKNALGTRVVGSVFLVSLLSTAPIPWSAKLGLQPEGTGGFYSTAVKGWVTFRVHDPARFFAAMWASGIAWTGEQDRSFKLSLGAVNNRETRAQLNTLTAQLIDTKLSQVILDAIIALEIPLNELAASAERIKLGIADPLATALREAGIEPEQLQVEGIQPMVRDPCVKCASTDRATGFAIFRRTIGLFIVRYNLEAPGNYCVPCALLTSLGYNATMLVCGWWGWISAFLSPFYFVGNLYNLGRMLLGPKGATDEPFELT